MCLVLATTVGCYHGRVTVERGDLAAAAVPLRTHGHVEVRALEHVAPQESERATTTVRIDAPVTAYFQPTRGISMERRAVTVRSLLAGCPAGAFVDDAATRAAYPACALLTVDSRIEVAERAFVRTDIVWSVAGTAVVGGAVGCAFACDDGALRSTSIGALAVTGLVLTGALVVIYAMSKID